MQPMQGKLLWYYEFTLPPFGVMHSMPQAQPRNWIQALHSLPWNYQRTLQNLYFLTVFNHLTYNKSLVSRHPVYLVSLYCLKNKSNFHIFWIFRQFFKFFYEINVKIKCYKFIVLFDFSKIQFIFHDITFNILM